jgi:hypothetical protein
MKVMAVVVGVLFCNSNVPSVFSLKLIWKSPSEADSKNPDRSHSLQTVWSTAAFPISEQN